MKKIPCIYLIIALIIALGACNDPIFYIISTEPPIADPIIGGSPTNFVIFNNEVYAASGRKIYFYDGTDDGKKWKPMSSQPGGRIVQLAATDSNLYALCLQDSPGSTTINLRRYSADWEDVTGETGGYDRLQSVYAANDKVFIGAHDKDSYNITLYIDEARGSTFEALTQGGTKDEPESLLCGIAFDSAYYYLCTRGNTIYQTDAAGVLNPKKPEDNVTFMGIINIGNDTILAISRNGNLYNVTGADITKLTFSADEKTPDISINRPSTGALAVWVDKDDASRRLLLAGRQDRLDYSVDSGYTYGYMELELDSSGIKAGKNFVEPGKDSPSSVADNERYVSTIGRYPVKHIFQTPSAIDPEMTLFASTQKNGVWSYRQRGSNKIWNAEE